ncbi:hypothetical protein Aph02nite_47150 [Actinoplanes philippinensis]|uniref:Anti-anti-sigma factor n=1 Tax=Actinoplanes philippinensis TaxID=35752 RepID=A0A1I2I284_9ACTN|nr:STAS domain-containing protein [Actinoplanes philippinensis]GIE78765.1 hypothetical protein Aph02nite_47150 [Actinoplanes philippinensis]SFF35743.1 anti-anti-sigma factor [Actinoplanes philippinensis]
MAQPVTGFPDTIRIDERDGAAVVTVRGDVDAAAVPLLRDVLAWAVTCHDRIVVDLSPAGPIDRAGLSALSAAQHRAGLQGVQLCFTAPSARLLAALCEIRADDAEPGFSLPAQPSPPRFPTGTIG